MLFYTKKRGLISSKRPLFIANFLIFSGANLGTRTPDLRITNALLYQLSYFGNICFFISGAKIQGLFDICKKIR